MKLLIVGDKPKKGTSTPFLGARCLPRLVSWIDQLPIDHYRLANQVDHDIEIVVKCHEGPIIALGSAAAKRLDKLGAKYFKLPHPSGRNRQLNDKAFEQQRLAECKEWLTMNYPGAKNEEQREDLCPITKNYIL